MKTNESRTQRLTSLGAIIALGLVAMTSTAVAAPPQVVTVPWRGVLDLQHEVYNGKQVTLKGVAHGIETGATASWDPGDGTGAIPVVPNPDASGFDFDLGVQHTYPASAAGTPYTATLEVCNGAECDSDTYRLVVRDRTLDVEINIAIDDGLWYLHRAQTRSTTSTDGRWYSNNQPATTASAVQSFQINNHFETGSPSEDPYADTVARGLKSLFSTLSSFAIGMQSAGNPDSNGNGLGIQSTIGSRPIYVGGQVIDAIVSTKTPTAVTTTGPNGAALPANIGGRTYADIVQDYIDAFSWGQYDTGFDTPGSAAGGWRYSWNQFPDNSACQWWAIGALAARDLFGATVPQFVIDQNLNNWLEYSQTPAPPADATGYGYTGRGSGIATSPSGLVQLIMDGIPKTNTAKWVGVENTMAANWNSWYRDTTNYYAMFALAKSQRLALPNPTIILAEGTANAIDWFKADCANPDACSTATDKWGVARTIIRDQNSNGQFTGSNWTSGDLHHAWGVIILTGTLRLEPVAVAKANPNPGASGVPIDLDGTGSFHQDPERMLVKYEWDFDNDGTFDAEGAMVSHPFVCATLPTPCDFPVTLKVTDDGTPTPLIDTDTVVVSITNPPHPPTSDPNGPYLACVDEEISLDGSGSFDVDEGTSLSGQAPFDTITSWGWETDFVAPNDFDEATGETAAVTFSTTGLKDIGLRVTDNSAAAFGAPNDLTDDAFTTARIFECGCVKSISARAKPGKVSLVWPSVANAASYEIIRSTKGANTGFSTIATGYTSDYATYLDTSVTNGVMYWYRVIPKTAEGDELCTSEAVAVTPPEATSRRRR